MLKVENWKLNNEWLIVNIILQHVHHSFLNLAHNLNPAPALISSFILHFIYFIIILHHLSSFFSIYPHPSSFILILHHLSSSFIINFVLYPSSHMFILYPYLLSFILHPQFFYLLSSSPSTFFTYTLSFIINCLYFIFHYWLLLLYPTSLTFVFYLSSFIL